MCIIRTYLETGREFHHLVGLDVLQAINTSDTVTDGQHATGFFQVGLKMKGILKKYDNNRYINKKKKSTFGAAPMILSSRMDEISAALWLHDKWMLRDATDKAGMAALATWNFEKVR